MAAIDRIETNPEIMLGKPVIRGTRVTVDLILQRLNEGATFEEITEMYPMTTNDVPSVVDYSRSL